jgi:phosphoenolpyruvate-protein kinase (PTS system EI component)
MTVRGKGEPGFAKGRAFVVDDRGQRNPFEDIPPGSVLIAKTISLSDSVMIDFKKVVGMVTEEEDFAGHVGLLSRGLGIPAVVGVGGCMSDIFNGDRILIRNLDVLVNPDLSEVEEFDRLRREADPQLSLDLQ